MGDNQEDDFDKNDKEDVPQYRFLLIGKSGTGKSSTGNTLLGYEKNHPNAFKTGTGFEPTTLSVELKEITRSIVKRKVKITVVDTPDIVHLKASHTVAEWKQLICPLDEPFTVLLTIRSDNRYTQEDFDTYQTTKRCLGNLINNNLIIVFTHFDEENDDLKSLISRNRELNKVFQDAKETYVTFDNSVRNGETKNDVEHLLKHIDAKQTLGNGSKSEQSAIDMETADLPETSQDHSVGKNQQEVSKAVQSKPMETNHYEKASRNHSPYNTYQLERTSEERRLTESRHQPSYREYGFLIIGSPGAGKSSTGNTILGYQKSDSKAFETKCDLQPTTDVATSKKEERCYGNKLRAIFTVVDTPNLEGEFGETLKEQLVKLVGNEEMFTVIHVIRCDRNYTPEDKKTYLALKKLLSDRLKTRIIIGFTFFDNMDSENDIRDILLQPPTGLSEALSDAQNRYVIFNNNADNDDKRNQVEALVDAVNFLEGNMKMKIGLLRDDGDGIISVKERIEEYLKSNGIDASIDIVPVNKRSSEMSRHHLFLYVIKENNVTEGVSDSQLLHELREERFHEVRRRCIIVIAMERSRNYELQREIQTNRNPNGLLQMFDKRIVYAHFDVESRKPDHSIHHDGHQNMDKQNIFKMIQTLILQNCFTQYSFPEIKRMQDHDGHKNDRSLSQSNVAKSKSMCHQS